MQSFIEYLNEVRKKPNVNDKDNAFNKKSPAERRDFENKVIQNIFGKSENPDDPRIIKWAKLTKNKS